MPLHNVYLTYLRSFLLASNSCSHSLCDDIALHVLLDVVQHLMLAKSDVLPRHVDAGVSKEFLDLDNVLRLVVVVGRPRLPQVVTLPLDAELLEEPAQAHGPSGRGIGTFPLLEHDLVFGGTELVPVGLDRIYNALGNWNHPGCALLCSQSEVPEAIWVWI